MANERRIFQTRVIDNGDGTGQVEFQLDGSGIAYVGCHITKKAWDTKPAPEATVPGDQDVSEKGGSNAG